MENQISPNSNPQSDEIDLGQLLQMIKRGIDRLFRNFLRLFVYFKKNAIKIGILGILGVALGIGLGKIITKRLKTDVIVKPNLESKNYLYSVVGEIRSNLIAKDEVFFEDLGIAVEDLKNFDIKIEASEKNAKESNIDDDIKYLELLEKFRGDDLISDVVRTEILKRSNLNHKITFFYKDPTIGRSTGQKLLNYINSNEYFNELVAISKDNAEEKIRQDQNLVSQIDGIIREYSEKLSRSGKNNDGRIVLDSEDQLDITGLLSLKNSIILDIERRKLEMQGQKEAIRIINFGKTQEVQKPFFGKNIVLFPLLFIGLFFLIDFLKYLNRKSKELQLQ